MVEVKGRNGAACVLRALGLGQSCLNVEMTHTLRDK